MEINYEDFRKILIKVGTVLEVKKNEKARKPSLILKVVLFIKQHPNHCQFFERGVLIQLFHLFLLLQAPMPLIRRLLYF